MDWATESNHLPTHPPSFRILIDDHRLPHCCVGDPKQRPFASWLYHVQSGHREAQRHRRPKITDRRLNDWRVFQQIVGARAVFIRLSILQQDKGA